MKPAVNAVFEGLQNQDIIRQSMDHMLLSLKELDSVNKERNSDEKMYLNKKLYDLCVFVLDDYHLVVAQPIHDGLAFLLDHMPPQMHLVITTREDPQLPLARLRVRGQLTELRAADLRFSLSARRSACLVRIV